MLKFILKGVPIGLLGLFVCHGLEASAPKTDTAPQIGSHIRAIFQDKSGSLWFGTDGEGVCRHNGKSLDCFTEREGLCSNFVQTIQGDPAGGVWFTTREGVCRYDGRAFTRLIDRDGRFLNTVDLGKERPGKPPGRLWFGARIGAYRYDGKSFSFVSLPDADAPIQSLPGRRSDQPNPYSVYSLLEDRAGNLWLGTESKGVCFYDGRFFTYFTEKGLDKAAVRGIFQDKAGVFWFGNNGGGVYRYDGISLVSFTEEKGLGNPDFPRTLKGKPGTLARVWTITQDNSGNLWFGTIDAGAWRYDGKALTNFTVKDGLGSDSIWTIYKDNSGILWFGTDGEGVYRYDGKSFVKFTGARSGD